MKYLIWDGPTFERELAQHGERLHVTYDDLTQETTIEGVYAEVEVAFGDRVPADHVRLAESLVDRGWARFEDEPAPGVPVPWPWPTPPPAEPEQIIEPERDTEKG